MYDLVDLDRREKTDKYIFDRDKHLSLMSEICLYYLLAEKFHIKYSFIEKDYTMNGKPVISNISNLYYSISHSGNKCIVGLSDISEIAFYRSMLHHRTEVYQEINDYLDVESRNNIRQHDSQEIVDSKNILLKQLPKSQVIVYQPGKVGSMSVNYSLISAGCKSLHVHSFYDFDWDKEFSKRDQERIMHQFTNTKIKVITMVRNPIPRDVSMFMQLFQEDAIPRHRCTMEWIIDENGNEVVVDKNYLVDPDLAVACQKFISHQTEYQFGWFDREIKRTFGVNIYQYPFDKEKGYTIIKDGNVEILLMKCEMIDSLENVIKEFCELSHFKLVRTNDGGQKENNFIYKLLKQRIHLSQDYVNSYLSNDKALHFYTKEEIIEGAKKVDKNF